MADKKLICEGNCVEDYGFHHGEVVPVIVSGFHTKKPMRFNYCEQAINIDEGRGFIVTREIEEEETFPASPLPTPAPVAELPKDADGKETIKDYLENRIKGLYEADAAFCKDRWDMNLGPNERGLAREMSNQVTFARQELQEALKHL